jgi:hypothetical protein
MKNQLITETTIDTDHMGCRIIYQGNILCCVQHKTTKENYRTAINALNLLLGFPLTDKQFEENGGKVEAFRSYGLGETS